MKIAALPGLLILLCSAAFAQTVPVTGTVTDLKGNPVPYAFISDAQLPIATFSDANGAFSIKVKPDSRLIASASFHKKTRLQLDKTTDVKIVMPVDSTNNVPVIDPKARNIFVQDETLRNIFEGDVTMHGSGEENLHGSRFLFADWVHGFAISPDDSIKQNDLYLFNYDKIGGDLIFTRNKATVFTVVKSEIKSFTLFDNDGHTYVFEDIPAIDKKHYAELVAADKKYKIYKNLGTKFIKNNFVTNGITSSGNNYDEYKDESEYYAVKLPDGLPIKFTFRKKAIKLAFAADVDKVTKYLADNDKEIDEDYLKGLLEYLDQ